MTRTLTFENDERSKVRFRLLWDGLKAGAALERKGEKTPTREERRSEVRIKRGLKKISAPFQLSETGEVALLTDDEPLDIDPRPRLLAAGGGLLTLEQPDFSRLQRYIGNTPWMFEAVEAANDLEDWLDAADKQD